MSFHAVLGTCSWPEGYFELRLHKHSFARSISPDVCCHCSGSLVSSGRTCIHLNLLDKFHQVWRRLHVSAACIEENAKVHYPQHRQKFKWRQKHALLRYTLRHGHSWTKLFQHTALVLAISRCVWHPIHSQLCTGCYGGWEFDTSHWAMGCCWAENWQFDR